MSFQQTELFQVTGQWSPDLSARLTASTVPYYSPENIDAPKEPIKIKADTSVATKLDSGKTNWSLMPFEAVEEICKVLEFGALKYNETGKSGVDSWNWAKGSGLGVTRCLNAVFRHLFAFSKGEKIDPESGLSHIAHAACGLIFILYYIKHKNKYNQE